MREKRMVNCRKNIYIFIFLLVLFICAIWNRPWNVYASETLVCNVSAGNDVDFQTALQDALDQNREDSSQRKLIINVARGTYYITGSLHIYSNTTLNMTGVTIKKSPSRTSDTTTMLRLGRLGSEWEDIGGHSGYTGASNITFNGGTWDACGGKYAIMRFGHAQNLTFNGVTYLNVCNKHHMEMSAVKNVIVNNCVFKNFKGSLTSSTNYEALQFDIMDDTHFGGYPPYDRTVTKDVTIKNCSFTNVQRGLGCHSAVAGSYFQNFTITNNSFNNCFGYGIFVMNFKNTKINGNVLNSCGSGILFASMTKNQNNFYAAKGKAIISSNAASEIKNNKITIKNTGYKNVNYGIQLFGQVLSSKKNGIPKGDYRISGITVSGNSVNLGSKGYAIWLQGAMKCTLSNNSITCCITTGSTSGNGDGIRLQASPNNMVSNNKITNKVTSGKASNMCGITVTESSNGTSVIGNTVKKASKDGIAIRCSKKVNVVRNKVSNCKRYGILVIDKATVKKVNGNKLKSNKKGGKKIIYSCGGKKIK